jgi:phosphate starvation-inducible PhoH-like protein
MSKKNNKNKKEISYKEFLNFEEIRLTETQQALNEKIIKNNIVFAYGPAGSSKTFTSLYTALKLFSEHGYKKIILTKPIESSGEQIGFLKGTLEEKVLPFTFSFYDNINKIIGPECLEMLLGEMQIEFRPLAYMRGSTFDNSIMILDEAQNCDFRQLMLYISRMGKNTKVIILGDVSQYDIKKDKVALPKFIEMIEDIKGVGKHEFQKEDVVRNKMLIEITERFEKWIDEGKITNPK